MELKQKFRCSILITSDHLVIREGLYGLLSRLQSFHVIQDKYECTGALRACVIHDPNILVLDCQSSSYIHSLIQKLDILGLEAKIVLFGYANKQRLAECIFAGAVGHFDKTTALQDISIIMTKAHRGDSPQVPPNLFTVLSHRERDVLNLLLKGYSNHALANHLSISKHTVKNHLYKIYQKLGVHTRQEVMRKYYEV